MNSAGGQSSGGGVFVVAEDGDALVFETQEEVRGVSFAVEDEGEAVKMWVGLEGGGGGLAGDVGEEARDDVLEEGLLEAGVDGFGDAEEGLAVERVDPVVGGAAEAEFFAADVAAG